MPRSGRFRRDRGDPQRGLAAAGARAHAAPPTRADIARARERRRVRVPDQGEHRRRARRARARSGDVRRRGGTLSAVLAFFSRPPRPALVGAVALILMHSGRDAGLGGMGFTPTSQGGTHIVERNLTRADDRRRGAVLREHGRALPPARSSRARCCSASLHHVTCVCSDAQRTIDFYRDELGFSLVKKTVNFDDPHSYHLYFGDEIGSPGSAAHVLRVAARRSRPARPRHARVDRPRDARGGRGARARGSRRAAAAAVPRASSRRCTTSSRSATPTSTPGSSTEDAPLTVRGAGRRDRR